MVFSIFLKLFDFFRNGDPFFSFEWRVFRKQSPRNDCGKIVFIDDYFISFRYRDSVDIDVAKKATRSNSAGLVVDVSKKENRILIFMHVLAMRMKSFSDGLCAMLSINCKNSLSSIKQK